MHTPVAQKSCLFGTSGETCVKEKPTDLFLPSFQPEGRRWLATFNKGQIKPGGQSHQEARLGKETSGWMMFNIYT